MNNLHIDQQNYKDVRTQYGIKMQSIADKCGISTSTISNFERCNCKYTEVYARPDTSKILIRALYDIIDEKLSGLFINKEEKPVETSNFENSNNSCLNNTVNKLMVRNAIVDWCNNNNVNVYEFCTMCDVNKSLLYDYKNHPYMYKSTVNKILAATGWTMDIFEKYKDSTEPIEVIQKKKGLVKFRDILEDVRKEVKKYVPENTTDLMAINNDTANYKKLNVRLYFEDGKFYEEYDRVVTVHEKKELTKEEFMTAVKEV